MVKIGSWTIFERTPKAQEKFKAGQDTGYTTKPKRKLFSIGENSWYSRCKHFQKLSEDYPLFNQSCLALAGMVMSQGVFMKPAVNKQEETYALAEEAMWRCKKLNQTLHVNSRFYESVLRMAKFGACFWEITYTPTFAFRLAPSQEYIEPAETNENGEVTRWRQVFHGTSAAEWPATPTGDQTFLQLVPWNVTSNSWPYGTSIGTGSETELKALIEMETNASAYMEKQAWPYEILALGDGSKGGGILPDDYQTARTEWKNRKPGQGIATRNTPVSVIPGGTGSTPIRELAVLCQLMKDNAHDGLMIAPISKLYNSTEASAKQMTKHIMTVLGQPIQWILKEAYEENVLQPYLIQNAFSVKNTPEMVFESPDVHKTEEGEYWVGLVGAGIQSPQQAADHLGLEYDEEYWTNEERRQLEQATKQQQGEKEEKQDIEEWTVSRKTRGNSKVSRS